jgi:hypothetical protein
MAVVEGIGGQMDPNLSLVRESVPRLLRNPDSRRILVDLGLWRVLQLSQQLLQTKTLPVDPVETIEGVLNPYAPGGEGSWAECSRRLDLFYPAL